MKIENMVLLIPLCMVCFGFICVWCYMEHNTANYITRAFRVGKSVKYIGPNTECDGEIACYKIKQIHAIEIRDDELFVTVTAKYKLRE